MKPYVVSGDINFLLSKWAMRNGFVLPSQCFMSNIREEFSLFMKNIFPSFEFVDEVEIANGIKDLVSRFGLETISLDRVYFQSKTFIDIARVVKEDGNDCGLGHRAGSPFLFHQFRSIKKGDFKEIALVDDVVFSGVLLERIIHCLSKMKIKVPFVFAGIGISEGIDRISNLRCEIHCVREYKEVVDEVCERDFYPGVPFSGRLLFGGKNIGFPYLLPFGNPGKWASIPVEWQESFSRFCIRQTIRLFEEIEKCSNKIVFCHEIDRIVMGLPSKARFVDALRTV